MLTQYKPYPHPLVKRAWGVAREEVHLPSYGSFKTKKQAIAVSESLNANLANGQLVSRFAPGRSIGSHEDVADIAIPMYDGFDREAFTIVSLNAKNVVIEAKAVHVGALTSCTVSPQVVFRNALLANASSIILVHNHPSNDLTPSADDLAITQKIVELGKELDIPVLDHIIVATAGTPKHLSMKQKNLI